jgi:hypothetical protein
VHAARFPNLRDSSTERCSVFPRRSSSQVVSGRNGARCNPRIIDQLTPYSEGPLNSDNNDAEPKPKEPNMSAQNSMISSIPSQPSPDVSPGGIVESCSSDTAFGLDDPPPESPFEEPKEAETLYDKLAHVLGLLGTDPAPTVAQHGKLALLSSGFDISHLPSMEATSASVSSLNASPRMFSSIPVMPLDAASLSRHLINGQGRAAGGPGSISSVGSSDLQGSRREPGLWSSLQRRFSSTVHRLSSSGSAPRGGPPQSQHPTVSPPPSQLHFSNMQQPRSPAGGASPTRLAPQYAMSVAAGAAPSRSLTRIITPLRPGATSGGVHAGPEPFTHATTGTAAASRPLRRPSSVVYKRLCQHFRRPMKLSKKQAPEAVLTLNVSTAHWGVISKIERKVEQKLSVLETLQAQAQQCRAATQPRLSDNVQVPPLFTSWLFCDSVPI